MAAPSVVATVPAGHCCCIKDALLWTAGEPSVPPPMACPDWMPSAQLTAWHGPTGFLGKPRLPWGTHSGWPHQPRSGERPRTASSFRPPPSYLSSWPPPIVFGPERWSVGSKGSNGPAVFNSRGKWSHGEIWSVICGYRVAAQRKHWGPASECLHGLSVTGRLPGVHSALLSWSRLLLRVAWCRSKVIVAFQRGQLPRISIRSCWQLHDKIITVALLSGWWAFQLHTCPQAQSIKTLPCTGLRPLCAFCPLGMFSWGYLVWKARNREPSRKHSVTGTQLERWGPRIASTHALQ